MPCPVKRGRSGGPSLTVMLLLATAVAVTVAGWSWPRSGSARSGNSNVEESGSVLYPTPFGRGAADRRWARRDPSKPRLTEYGWNYLASRPSSAGRPPLASRRRLEMKSSSRSLETRTPRAKESLTEPRPSGAGPVSSQRVRAGRTDDASGSTNSPPALAAAELEQRDPLASIRFVSAACSGATLEHILRGDYKGRERRRGDSPDKLPSQFVTIKDAIPPGRQIDALVFGGGGNDVRFGDFIADCNTLGRDCSQVPNRVQNLVKQGFRHLTREGGLYDQLVTQIVSLSQSNPVARVYVVEYPDSTRNERGAFSASVPLHGIKLREARWAHNNHLVPLERVHSVTWSGSWKPPAWPARMCRDRMAISSATDIRLWIVSGGS